MTDIYGANLYNHYLAQQHTNRVTATKLVSKGIGSQVTRVEEEELVSSAAACRSILVGGDNSSLVQSALSAHFCAHLVLTICQSWMW